MSDFPVIDLSKVPNERGIWGRPKVIVYLWGLVELLFVTNPLQISSFVRVFFLRIFGAKIGRGVVFRPRTRVRFPWKLEIGDHTWIGEGVWLHNQNLIQIGSHCVISQDTFLTTGSHDLTDDMSLITRPILVEDGVWITCRCVVLGGVSIGRNSVIGPLSVIRRDVKPNVVFIDANETRARFTSEREV